MTLEREVEQYLDWCVQVVGGKTYKWESPMHRGVADRIVCLPDGQTWMIELKKPKGGRLSPLQVIFAADMTRLKQNYKCLFTKEEITKWLSGAGYTTP